jgi:hypothetical protein
MLIPAAVSLLLAAPPVAPPDPHKVFTLGFVLSQAVVFRMDSMPANVNADGAKALQGARTLAARLDLPLPDDAVLKGEKSDTAAALGYVMQARQHPITQLLQQRHGRAPPRPCSSWGSSPTSPSPAGSRAPSPPRPWRS